MRRDYPTLFEVNGFFKAKIFLKGGELLIAPTLHIVVSSWNPDSRNYRKGPRISIVNIHLNTQVR